MGSIPELEVMVNSGIGIDYLKKFATKQIKPTN